MNLEQDRLRGSELAREGVNHVAFWVIVAAVVPALLTPVPAALSAVAIGSELTYRLLLLVIDSAVTAVAEELVFRGLLLFGAIWVLRIVNAKMPIEAALFRAVILQSAAFAVAHVVGMDSLQLGSFSLVGGGAVVVALQAVAKLAQAFLFAMCMACLVLKTNNLLLPILMHFLFDLIYFAPTVLTWGSFPETYLTGSVFDFAIVAISAAILAIPAVRVLITMKRGVNIRPQKRVV